MDPVRRRRRLIVIFGVAAAAPTVAALVFFLAPATGFSPQALNHSVGRETDTGTLDGAGCDRHVKGDWSCSVYALGGSGFVDYRVAMRGSRCWRARRSPGGVGAGLPKRIDGCLKVRDQVRVWERVWDAADLVL